MQRIGVILAVIAVLFIFSGVACGDGCGCGHSRVYIRGGHHGHRRRGWFGWGRRRRGFRRRGFRGRGFRGGGRSWGK